MRAKSGTARQRWSRSDTRGIARSETSHGGIGPTLDRVRDVLEPWLGRAGFDQSPVAPKLTFRADAEDRGPPLRLKVEINIREIDAYDKPQSIRYTVENPWFTGHADISTYSREEMLATKLRALLQRDQGRDLLDLSHALSVFGKLDLARVAAMFGRYLAAQNLAISRAQAEERMFAKLGNPGFFANIRPLLRSDEADRLNDDAVKLAFAKVFTALIAHIPGDPWARTAELSKRYDLVLDSIGRAT